MEASFRKKEAASYDTRRDLQLAQRIAWLVAFQTEVHNGTRSRVVRCATHVAYDVPCTASRTGIYVNHVQECQSCHQFRAALTDCARVAVIVQDISSLYRAPKLPVVDRTVRCSTAYVTHLFLLAHDSQRLDSSYSGHRIHSWTRTRTRSNGLAFGEFSAG